MLWLASCLITALIGQKKFILSYRNKLLVKDFMVTWIFVSANTKKIKIKKYKITKIDTVCAREF